MKKVYNYIWNDIIGINGLLYIYLSIYYYLSYLSRLGKRQCSLRNLLHFTTFLNENLCYFWHFIQYDFTFSNILHRRMQPKIVRPGKVLSECSDLYSHREPYLRLLTLLRHVHDCRCSCNGSFPRTASLR